MCENQNFVLFADFIFSQKNPPAPNSIMVDLSSDEDLKNLAIFLVKYGIKTKIKGEISSENFKIIAEYILSLGVEVELKNINQVPDEENIICRPYYKLLI